MLYLDYWVWFRDISQKSLFRAQGLGRVKSPEIKSQVEWVVRRRMFSLKRRASGRYLRTQ